MKKQLLLFILGLLVLPEITAQTVPPKEDNGLTVQVGEFIIPSYTASSVGNTGTFKEPVFGEVTWKVDSKYGGYDNNHAGMTITYTYTDLNEEILSAFIQEINRFQGKAGSVILSCSLASTVRSNSITVTCARTENVKGWPDNYGFLLTLLY